MSRPGTRNPLVREAQPTRPFAVLGLELVDLEVGCAELARQIAIESATSSDHSEDAVLPWTALLNFGFGDGGDELPNDDERPVARRN